MNRSPLRYPGGKAKLAPLIKLVMDHLPSSAGTYIEPFAGGAGVALDLLFNGTVEQIVINDYDKAIYSFWRAVVEDTNELIHKIETTQVSIEEWRRQREIYFAERKYSVDLAFATFYLNRTNRSGILKAGPIGGKTQSGEWKLDARYNKSNLIERITKIANEKKRIKVYNKDIYSFIEKYIVKYDRDCFVYFDPPYFNKGKDLYKNFLDEKDHKKIAMLIEEKVKANWMMTYDNVQEIKRIYDKFHIKEYDLRYSLAKKTLTSEIIIFKNEANCPTTMQMEDKKININMR